jgi:hypothetical protein
MNEGPRFDYDCGAYLAGIFPAARSFAPSARNAGRGFASYRSNLMHRFASGEQIF